MADNGDDDDDDNGDKNQPVVYSPGVPKVFGRLNRSVVTIIDKANKNPLAVRTRIRHDITIKEIEFQYLADKIKNRIVTSDVLSGVAGTIATASLVAMALNPVTIPLLACSFISTLALGSCLNIGYKLRNERSGFIHISKLIKYIVEEIKK